MEVAELSWFFVYNKQNLRGFVDLGCCSRKVIGLGRQTC